ncbi:MAG TPA: hypothetical protein DCE41_35635 [Cytophagales bacterium]|nr:hypothetical protein [Cytophagales bacterium]HAA21093.1 hypothetical protein [Cytophagales bacterium]HAP65161.1 hypothetical protein [Cytophagales bacterium]
MRLPLFTVFLIFIQTFSYSQTHTWKVKEYTVQFEIYNAGVSVDGSLKGLNYNLSFSPNELEYSSLFASVAVSTIDTGIGARDRHLQSSDYFDTQSYPNITLQSTSIAQVNRTQYEGLFKCTIKDITQSIAVPFSFEESGDEAVLESTFSINRLDFGVGTTSLIMDDEVEVSIRLVVEAKP